jgi:hypothetical protein
MVNFDTLWVQSSRKLGRILSPFDIGNLSGGKTDDLISRVVFEIDVKIVEIAPGGSHDDYSFNHRNSLPLHECEQDDFASLLSLALEISHRTYSKIRNLQSAII